MNVLIFDFGAYFKSVVYGLLNLGFAFALNFDFSCSEMHELISKDQKLLKQIFNGEKYSMNLPFKSVNKSCLYKNAQFFFINKF